MSFPGHAKSIRINQEPDSTSRRESSDQYKRLHEQERQTGAEPSDLRKRAGHGSLDATDIASLTGDRIVDDRGNGPSRSLWVGNTLPGMRNSQLYDKFGVFGTIESATTKPMTKYSFVNFVDVDHAITAWKTLHGKSVFQDDKPLHIRFTTTVSEAKHAKDEVNERKSSTSTKVHSAKVDWSQASSNDQIKVAGEDETDAILWPNGLPPSGPKSRRKAISPPPLRRGDSYRPSDQLTEYDTYRHNPAERDIDRGTRRRGPDIYRPAPTRRQRSRGRSISKSISDRSSRSSSRCASPRDRNMNSPLPWECRYSSGPTQPDDILSKIRLAKQRAQVIATHLLEQQENFKADNLVQPPQRFDIEGRTRGESSAEAHKDTRPQCSEPYSRESHSFGQDQLHGEFTTSGSNLANLLPCSTVSTIHSSPDLRLSIQGIAKLKSSPLPRGSRLRLEKDETCSINSELTSSTKSSLRKKKCADCKKLGSDLSRLTACSTCPRRFHSGCGDPRPSSCSVKTTFRCGRCLRERKGNLGTATTPTESAKSHLASPPLSLNNNDPNDASSLPSEPPPRIEPTDNNNISFFQSTTPQPSVTATNILLDLNDEAVEKRYIRTTDGAADVKNAAPIPRGPSKYLSQQEFEQVASSNMQRYKSVTCHWWKREQCWLAEEQCLYAHRETGIHRPEGRHPSKSWTCWQWLNGDRCPRSEQGCLYAHKDTGLHLTSVGKISLKHITCVWWIKGNACKWSGTTCRFAHMDTGVYALEPTDKRSRGSAISSVRPVPLWKVPKTDQDKEGCGSELELPASITATEARLPQVDGPSTHKTEKLAGASNADNAKSYFSMRFDENIPIYARPQRRVSLVSAGAREALQETDSKVGRQSLPNQVDSQTVRTFEASISGVPLPQSLYTRSERMTPMKSQASMRLDPRKRKQVVVSDISGINDPPMGLVSGIAHQSVDKDADIEILGNNSPERAHEGSTGHGFPTPASSRTKKCKVCSKIVFNDVLCRGCKEIKPMPHHVPPVSATHSPSSAYVPEIPKEQPIQNKVLDDVADFVMDDFGSVDDEQPEQIKPVVQVPTKRAASGDNMFISNKRPKSSMAFSHSGLPRTITNGPLKPVRLSDRLPPKSLEELAREARIQNGKLLEGSVLSPNTEPETAIEIDFIDTTLDSDIMSKSANMPAHEDDKQSGLTSLRSDPVTDELEAEVNHSYSASLSESEQGFPSSAVDPLDIPYDASVTEQKLWSSSISPEHPAKPVRSVVKACQECNEKHRKCTHGNLASIPKVVLKLPTLKEPLVGKAKGGIPLEEAIPERNKPGAGESIPYACDTCRRHHKKCLHKGLGQFDPERCLTYIRTRSSRPSCYSSAEWERIVEAAEQLEQSFESNREDVLDDATSEGHVVDLAKSEDLASSPQYHDEKEPVYNRTAAFIQAMSRKIHQDLPPTLSAFESLEPRKIRLRGKSRIRHDDWTPIEHEEHTKKLGKQGVMLESDSDSDNYASDDSEVQGHLCPIDPLHVPPKTSRDLYELCPGLSALHLKQHEIRSSKHKASRKEEWKNLRATQLRKRYKAFGNPHREVDRKKPDPMVTAIVERVMPGTKDILVPEVQTRQEIISFRNFLGLPKQPVACLMEDRATLAYRDTIKDNDYPGLITSTRAFGRQVMEEDRLPVYDK